MCPGCPCLNRCVWPPRLGSLHWGAEIQRRGIRSREKRHQEGGGEVSQITHLRKSPREGIARFSFPDVGMRGLCLGATGKEHTESVLQRAGSGAVKLLLWFECELSSIGSWVLASGLAVWRRK